MMELSHSLTLNEDVLKQLPEQKRPVFVFEWLRFLDKVLLAAQKSDIKGCQKKLQEQLLGQIQESPGPPTRRLLGRCLASLFSVGDTFLLFDAVSRCNDLLKIKEETPNYLQTRLAAVTCIGTMYEKLGRMMGRSYEETVHLLFKCLKNAESQLRHGIMEAMEKIVAGMGTAACSIHKEIFKVTRHCLTDRAMSVRCASAKCFLEMVKHSPFLYTSDLETVASLCFRAFEGSTYDVRCAVAQLLGVIMATTQKAPQLPPGSKARLPSLDEVLSLMALGFLKGGIGFLKTGAGEIIKGGAPQSRDIRVGVTHTYVVFLRELGRPWFERHLNPVLTHLLELVASPKASTTHVDAVYSRKCASFILRTIIGKLLGEMAQAAACKDIVQVIVKHVSGELSVETGKEDLALSQHVLVCALNELGCLLESLGSKSATVVNDPSSGLLESVLSVLNHSSCAARLSAAWCLRCVALAVPSQLTPLLEKCLERLENLKTSPDAIAGHSAALAALLGTERFTQLGIPHNKGKIIFNVAEDLLRCASQNSRLSLHRTQAGWLMIGAVMTLGPAVVRGLLPRLLLLWKNSFPRSAKELESEKARGDAFTWQLTLEGRAGALAAMASFLKHSKELATEDVIRRIMSPIESALVMLTNVSGIIRSYGQHLKASSAMVRLRLYEVLSLLPPQSFEGAYSNLLRLLVAEFTLTENQANTTTSLLRDFCHADDSVILGSWLQETDHKVIEDQLQLNSAAGSGALEHDTTFLYKVPNKREPVPGPLPLGVSVIDMSVLLFGLVFPYVAFKHRVQMLDHFLECIKNTKSLRQEAVQINIFTAVLSALKSLADLKAGFGSDEVRKAAVKLILSSLGHSNSILRCASGEALGRMAQVVGDGRFVAEMAQHSFDRLKTARDVVSRTGHSLALGCLHRYVGGMGSGQYLNTSVSILLALAQDTNSPIVQVWALHALALIADSGGPMFRGYVEPTLSVAVKLLLNVAPTIVDVHLCVGKCLSAMITTLGPELQGNSNSICTARSSLLMACAIMQDHDDCLVQAEAIACLQQMHMFAPRHVNLSTLVPTLCAALGSPHLLLRRAVLACLRQLSHREAREVCEHAASLSQHESSSSSGDLIFQESTGLPGVLFSMLDKETDERITADIHDSLTSMLQALVSTQLGQWLSLCKGVLTSAESSSDSTSSTSKIEDQGDNEVDLGDEVEFKATVENLSSSQAQIPTRWPTRVFAAQSLCRILKACEDNPLHFDMTSAKEQQQQIPQEDFLVLHLSDLVRMGFMAATSDSDPLRLVGLKTLQLIIDKFSNVPEPEFPGHVILEQYQAQVGAALRPAFSPETPSHITAVACEVCSAWIGSGVARDLNDLRRVHQLLVSSLAKLRKPSCSQLYNESASTLEKLAILKAWAEVYIVAMENERQSNITCKTKIKNNKEDLDIDHNEEDQPPRNEEESLLRLVSPELVSLSHHWLATLKDQALLSLPPDFSSQLPLEGGAFYTSDTKEAVRKYYQEAWPPILHATAVWLCTSGFQTSKGSDNNGTRHSVDGIDENRFHLLFGICMEALCRHHSSEPLEFLITCLQALNQLLGHPSPRHILGSDPKLAIELCSVLHRLLLTRESAQCQHMVIDTINLIVHACKKTLDMERKQKLKALSPANQEPPDDALCQLGDGGEQGVLQPGGSVVFALLEVSVCLLVRHLPQLSPTLANTAGLRHRGPLTTESAQLVAAMLKSVVELPSLCSPAGSVLILPTVLHLLIGVLRETAVETSDNDLSEEEKEDSVSSCKSPIGTILFCLERVLACPLKDNLMCKQQWTQLLQSALACVLDLSKTSSEGLKPDELSLLMAASVFIKSASSQVICIPNLQYPCINLFKQLLQKDSYSVQLHCVKMLCSVFGHPDLFVSTPYIHALAPILVEITSQTSASLAHSHTFSEQQRILTMECLGTLEVLVTVAAPENRIHMCLLYVPILISLLVDPSLGGVIPPSRIKLHEFVLQRLRHIGPQYPQEFRSVMNQMPSLRTRLEGAVKTGSGINTQGFNNCNSEANTKINVTKAPTIKLKTSFSNFTG